MSAHIYGTTWPVEIQEMMKDADRFLLTIVITQLENWIRHLGEFLTMVMDGYGSMKPLAQWDDASSTGLPRSGFIDRSVVVSMFFSSGQELNM